MANPKFQSDTHPNDLWGKTAPSGVLYQLDRSMMGYPARIGNYDRNRKTTGAWAVKQNVLHAVDWAANQQLRDGHPYPTRYWRLIKYDLMR